MKEYFKNLKAEINEVVDLSVLELLIPEGFNKQLNSIEKMALVDDQLLQHGLTSSNQVINGGCRIVEASKNARPLEQRADISSRLREYLKLINSQEV